MTEAGGDRATAGTTGAWLAGTEARAADGRARR